MTHSLRTAQTTAPQKPGADTLTDLAAVVAALDSEVYLGAARRAGVASPSDLLGRAHIIDGLARDPRMGDSALSALERDVDNSMHYEFVRGTAVYLTMRDPSDWSRGYRLSVTLESGREEPYIDVWAFDAASERRSARWYSEHGDESEDDFDPIERIALSFGDIETYLERP